MHRQKHLIETVELAQLIASGSNIRIINATRQIPNPLEAHLAQRITLATSFFDHDAICDKSAKIPLTFPPLNVFTDAMKSMGVPKDVPIIMYDV